MPIFVSLFHQLFGRRTLKNLALSVFLKTTQQPYLITKMTGDEIIGFNSP